MIGHEGGLLAEAYSTSYQSKSRPERRELIGSQNIALTFSTENTLDERRTEVEKLSKIGYSPVSLRFILAGFSYMASQEGMELPYPMYGSIKDVEALDKKARADINGQQDRYVNSLASKIVLTKDSVNGQNRLSVIKQDGTTADITERVNKFLIETDDSVELHYNNRICLGKAIGILKNYMEQHTGILAILDAPIVNQKGPSILIDGIEKRFFNQKQADRVISANTNETQHFGIVREAVRFGYINAQRKHLQEQINNGNIKLVNAFKRDEWPSHPLMSRIKALSAPIITEEVKKSGIQCDEQDIRYQTLFRLATFSLHELFEHGDQLHKELLDQGSYYSWAKIPKINDVLLEQFQIQKDVVRTAVQEQLVIINNRLKKSDLPLNEILTPSGIFTEKDWKFLKCNNDLFITNKETGQKIPVDFREVDNNLATSYHRDLHYIHTPRSGTSFGLFLDKDELPFSVLAIEKIDRKYKQNVLLAMGYDPEQCIDFTRLYSRPGVPFNTSSAIFACAFQYIEKNSPNIQVALSAFMPTYASGLSMISGGFDTPVIIKDGRQTFQERQIDGTSVWEHVTARRKNGDKKSIKSAIPMFPTVELLRPIRKPRFQPLEGINGKMFEI